jgi:hypothetical protein
MNLGHAFRIRDTLDVIYILLARLQTFQPKQLRSHYLVIYSWIENRNSEPVEHKGTVGIPNHVLASTSTSIYLNPIPTWVGIYAHHIGMSQPFLTIRPVLRMHAKTMSFI